MCARKLTYEQERFEEIRLRKLPALCAVAGWASEVVKV